MESPTSTSTAASTSRPPADHANPDDGFNPKNHYGSLVGGRTRPRVNASFVPATPPPCVAAANKPPIAPKTKLPFYLERFVRSIQRSNVSENGNSLVLEQIEPPTQHERTRWDVENTPENQKIWKEFVDLSSIPVPSPPSKVSASSIYIDAQIALSQFTPMDKLRAILIGSNRKSVRMGEMYFSPLSAVDELIPTSALIHGDGFDNNIVKNGMNNALRRVVANLHTEFSQTADLMENFIFPVKLIDPFNMAICIINRSPFLRYLLVRWRDLVWSTGLGQSLTGTRCNFTSPRATANPEILFLEWYIASSQPMIRCMLNALVRKAGLEYQRLMIDFGGNALLLAREESIGKAITREIEIMATVRRELSVAIDALFRQRVEMLRSPLGTMISSKKETREGDTLARKARKRDSRGLRVKMGKRACASLSLALRVDDDNDYDDLG